MNKIIIKKLLGICLSLCCVFTCFIVDTSAKKTNECVVYDCSNEEIRINEEAAYNQMVSGYTSNQTGISLLNDSIETKWVKHGDSKTVVKKAIGYAANQPSGGVVFNTANGYIYWQNDSSASCSVNCSINFGYGAVSVGLSVPAGKRSSGVTSYGVSCPLANTPYKLYIYKDLLVTQYSVYEKNTYESESAWRFVGYTYTYTATRYYLEARKV